MKFRPALFFALISVVALRAADDLPVFNAILAMGKEQRFVLVGPGGKSSSWLKLGDVFGEYRLKAYDAKAAGLDLERDGKITRVTLVADAAIANAPLAPTPATLADAEEVFRLMRFDEMMNKMLDAQKKTMGPIMQQSVAQSLARMNMTLSEEEKSQLSALQGKVMDETLGVITGPEMRAAMAKIYSEVFTKEDLNSMAAFYSTPGGQALIDKQPEAQQKMMTVMMPMIMKNQQGAQQKLATFMTGVMTKHAAGGAAAAPAPNP